VEAARFQALRRDLRSSAMLDKIPPAGKRLEGAGAGTPIGDILQSKDYVTHVSP